MVDTLKAEADSWLIDDPKKRKDKEIRERIRYPLLKKQMGLDYLDTSDMYVGDIGAGPLGGVSSIMNTKSTVRIDPIANEYKKYYHLENYINDNAEDLKEELYAFDLIIITNAMDHFQNPQQFLKDLVEYTKPSCYFAHIHAINNAYSHRHEAHEQNVNPEMMWHHLHPEFELVWNLDYQHDYLLYGWKHQPAFAQLWRNIKSL